MRAVVLGSAQDGGLPQLGADHPNDVAAREGRLPRRTASSVAVVGEEGVLLLDVSPDVRIQYDSLCGELGATPPITAVALTHGHMGHYAGLVHFGKEAFAGAAVPALVTASMAAYLESNEPWRSLLTDGHLRALVVDKPTEVGGHVVKFIPVPHRAEHTDAVAISVDESLLYLPDIDSWDEWPDAESVIRAHDIALLDASFYADGEVVGRDMSVFPHPRVVDTIERFAHLAAATRIILTHLNHTNPLVDPLSPQRREVEHAGFEVAEDLLRLGF